MKFEVTQWLAAVWLAPALAGLVIYAVSRRRAMLRRFVDAGLLPFAAAGASPARQAIKGLMLALALGLAVVALARPQWGAQPEDIRRKGRDICFIIDVSRSMLAQDLAPSRLERAKLWMGDVLAAARSDRVAIVAFAGIPSVKCPLTHDYAFARMALDTISTDSVPRGGTLIGDAIRAALSEVFDDKDTSFKDIILITDGEDQESLPVEAARAAGEAGVRIIAIGIGDENVGRPIPVSDPRTGERRLLTYNGETVLSKLDAVTLRLVAEATPGGRYFNVSTGSIELDKVYAALIRQAEQRELETTRAVRYTERFQLFLAAALALIALERLISERRR